MIRLRVSYPSAITWNNSLAPSVSIGSYPSSSIAINWFLARDASSLSSRSSSFARRSIITNAEVVKNLA